MKDAFQRAGLGPANESEISCDRSSTVRMSRDRLFGLWIADRLGKDSSSAEAYAVDIASENFDNSGDIYMLYRVRADLVAAGLYIPMSELLTGLAKAEMAARQGLFRRM